MEMESVSYFPSYEIITSTHSRGAYFEPDLRSVRETGVSHVMRIFSQHYLVQADQVPQPAFRMDLASTESEIHCDEAMIEQTLKAGGFSS